MRRRRSKAGRAAELRDKVAQELVERVAKLEEQIKTKVGMRYTGRAEPLDYEDEEKDKNEGGPRAFRYQDFLELQRWSQVREEDFEDSGLAVGYAYKALSGAVGAILFLRYGGCGDTAADKDNESGKYAK